MDATGCGAADIKRGFNQLTACGKPFWVLDPRPEDIRILDIAAHLSRICRYNGALRDDIEIYSVAQHSVLVSEHVPPEHALEALLHDAAESYVGDRVRPVKHATPGFDIEEHGVDQAIRRKYGLPPKQTPCVKAADNEASATERRDVCPENMRVDWGPMPDPWPEKIVPLLPSAARSLFLERFIALTADC